jgi:mono/diheme cytochrome c family protein
MGLQAADSLLAPALAKSAWLANNGNVGVLARILLKGQTGPIDGVTYGAGLMPPLEHTHTDQQIADVMTYAGERWHSWNRPATSAEVTAIRQALTTRQAPWTQEELKAVKP